MRDVQLARRRMAKRWHPDIAPPGKQHEHERHLQAINDMADELERLAEGSRGGKISRNAGARVGGRRRAGARRGGPARLRGRAACPRRRRGAHPPRPVRQPRARPLGGPPLRALPQLPGVGRRQRHRDLLHRRRRRRAASGPACSSATAIRTVPAGSLSFVDFSTPDPAGRPRRALHDRGPARARRGRLRARRAAPDLRARRRAPRTCRCCA